MTRPVATAFVGAGFAFASWASRIPQVRDGLHVTTGHLGLLLLSIAVGSLLTIPAAGRVVGRWGEARTVAAGALTLATGLAIVAVGHAHQAPLAVGLFLLGAGNGAWDIAMNVQAATVERRLGRSIMSRFHAGFSVGTVAGAGVGTLAVAAGVSVTVHLLLVAGLVAAVVPVVALRGFVHARPHADVADAPAPARRSAWREPRTLLIGLFVLCMAFTEGTGNDWLGVAVIGGYRTSAVWGTTALALFLAAMTTGRWFGPHALDRWGRVPVLRVCALVAVVGLLLVVAGIGLPVALAGAVLWGLGASLGFPTGMSAAADDPRRAAARVSVAASIAYLAFLAGPPVIGFVDDHVGVLRGLLVAVALLVVAVLVGGALAVEGPQHDESGRLLPTGP